MRHHSQTLHIDELVCLSREKFTSVPTHALEKVLPSLLNAIFVFGLATPILIFFGPYLIWKWSVVIIFGLYEFAMYTLFKDRCLGMKIMDTYYAGRFSKRQHLLYSILYTLSFSTVLISAWFPLDLLLFNIFCVQLPCVLITGTTVHGFMSNIQTVKIVAK